MAAPPRLRIQTSATFLPTTILGTSEQTNVLAITLNYDKSATATDPPFLEVFARRQRITGMKAGQAQQQMKKEFPESSLSNPVSRGEVEFLDHLRQQASKRSETSSPPVETKTSVLLCGIGDDAAVIKQITGRDTVVTTDLLVEDIDFLRAAISPQQLGHKALAVSLSDIAAMGARPRWSLLSLGIPQDIWNSDFVDSFFEGFFALAKKYDVKLVGGDVLSTAEKITVDSIVIGECRGGQAILRSGAKPGQQLFVTGLLGASAAGQRMIERGAHFGDGHSNDDLWDVVKELMLRQLSPEPRVGWGLLLGQERLASALIDISDGLSSDLHHLCVESKVGAVIESHLLPIDPLVTRICGRRALDPLILALNGGEDFELLFTVTPENVSRLPRKVDGVPITRIGEIKATEAGVRLVEGSRISDLQPQGWEHFRRMKDEG